MIGTPETWLTRAEAARYLRVSKATLDRLAREHGLRHYLGDTRSVRFRRDQLDALLTPAA